MFIPAFWGGKGGGGGKKGGMEAVHKYEENN